MLLLLVSLRHAANGTLRDSVPGIDPVTRLAKAVSAYQDAPERLRPAGTNHNPEWATFKDGLPDFVNGDVPVAGAVPAQGNTAPETLMRFGA